MLTINQTTDTKAPALRIQSITKTRSAREQLAMLPLSEAQAESVARSRQAVEAIVQGRDPRLLVVVGPCSIHDMNAAREYAKHLRELADEVSETMLLVMRTYFQKPRTTIGWTGFMNEPRLDGVCRLDEGRHQSRELLLYLASLGLPAATEFLDGTAPHYIGDLLAWSALGARTVESPTHRHMASGLSMPVGMKNSTSGDVMPALNAMKAAAVGHQYEGIDHNGSASVMQTSGNPDTHVVLRGGANGPNFYREHVVEASKQLEESGLCSRIMIDASHANAQGNYQNQIAVCRDVVETARSVPGAVLGLMIESNLNSGKQAVYPTSGEQLQFGVSVTDGCIGFADTRELIREMHQAFES